MHHSLSSNLDVPRQLVHVCTCSLRLRANSGDITKRDYHYPCHFTRLEGFTTTIMNDSLCLTPRESTHSSHPWQKAILAFSKVFPSMNLHVTRLPGRLKKEKSRSKYGLFGAFTLLNWSCWKYKDRDLKLCNLSSSHGHFQIIGRSFVDQFAG